MRSPVVVLSFDATASASAWKEGEGRGGGEDARDATCGKRSDGGDACYGQISTVDIGPRRIAFECHPLRFSHVPETPGPTEAAAGGTPRGSGASRRRSSVVTGVCVPSRDVSRLKAGVGGGGEGRSGGRLRGTRDGILGGGGASRTEPPMSFRQNTTQRFSTDHDGASCPSRLFCPKVG